MISRGSKQMNKNSGRIGLGFPIIALMTFYMMSVSCGTVAPDIGENECPEPEDPTTAATVSAVTSGVGGTSSVSTASSVSSVATSTGSGMEAEVYDVPMADEVASRLHSCHKLTYSQLGNFLRNRGVSVPPGGVSDLKNSMVTLFGSTQSLGSIFGGSNNVCEMADTAANGSGQGNDPLCPAGEVCFCNQDDKVNEINRGCLDVGNNSPDAKDGYCVSKPSTAGYLYFSGKDALGVPKLDSRLSEKDEHSTASAMRLMDIFVQSAPQIIMNIGNSLKAPACTLNGKNRPMFDLSDGSCVEESVSCLIGQPATEDHMLLCNLIVQKANPGDQTDLTKKRNIAVAVLLSAAHSCQ